MIERVTFSIFLILSGLQFNKFRIVALVLALLPIGLINLINLNQVGDIGTRRAGFILAIFIFVAMGFIYHFRTQQLRRELEANLLENQLIED